MNRCSKIICIGQNYAEHAKELNFPVPTEPVIFLKPPSALIGDGEAILVPDVGRVDHEVELAVVMRKRTKNVSEKEAAGCIGGVAVFNDVTARDVQSRAKKAGMPWALSKGMDTFAPMSEPVSIDRVPDIHHLDLELRVNGQLKQKGNTGDMVFSPERLIEYISRFVTLERGDIIATGTPPGISPIKPGDLIEAEIRGVGKLSNPVRRA